MKLSPEQISFQMDGCLQETAAGRWEALLPSPCIQNHDAFLAPGEVGIDCLWFGGSLEGKVDIWIYRASLGENDIWSPAQQLSEDPYRSEQNPLQFLAPDRCRLIMYTAQPGGNLDAAVVRMRVEGAAPRDLPLPAGTFIRSPIHVRDDGAWLLPLFRCLPQPGYRWNGSHDAAVLAVSRDGGEHWREIDVPDSVGCVHMTLVTLGISRLATFFRRRQADFVYRSESTDGGESWSVPLPTDVPNNNSSISVIALRGGRLAMACNPVSATMHDDRRVSLYDELGENPRPSASGGCKPIWGVPHAPLSICISDDEGLTFTLRIAVDDSPGTCLSNDSLEGKNFELSYPSMIQSEDGTLDFAYTFLSPRN